MCTRVRASCGVDQKFGCIISVSIGNECSFDQSSTIANPWRATRGHGWPRMVKRGHERPRGAASCDFSKPPRLAIFDFLKTLEIFENIFWCFGLLSKLKVCNVSVAASSRKIDVGSSIMGAQNQSGEVWWGQNWCVKQIQKTKFLQRYVC